jgi:hypothetical protein
MGKDGTNWHQVKNSCTSLNNGNHENFLTRVRKQDLHSINIEPDKQTIAEIFEDLNSLVGPISASKVLHLICPGFFHYGTTVSSMDVIPANNLNTKIKKPI